MYYRIAPIFIIMLMIFFVQSTSAEVDMKDGLWEITVKMDMPGMPMEMPAVKNYQCLTDRDNVPQNRAPNQECEIKKPEVRGNAVYWEVHCISQGQTMKGTGEVVYSGDTFKGGINMEMDGMNMTQHMSGRRVGDCK